MLDLYLKTKTFVVTENNDTKEILVYTDKLTKSEKNKITDYLKDKHPSSEIEYKQKLNQYYLTRSLWGFICLWFYQKKFHIKKHNQFLKCVRQLLLPLGQ